MSQTIDDRTAELEKHFEHLKRRIPASMLGKKDWRTAAGKLTDNELAREADRLGAEWRKNEPGGA
jgi:hypothetical protein